jgi:NNP family nitrate/nitrite transporter-like MFS transporter
MVKNVVTKSLPEGRLFELFQEGWSLPDTPANHEAPFRSQLGPMVYLVLIFLLNFMGRVVLAPLMPAIEEDLGLTHSQSGSLFLLITAGYVLTVIGSGFVSARLNHRRTIVLSALTLGLALVFVSRCQSLWALRMGLLGLGMAAGLYLPSGIAMLTTLVSSRHWGKAMAIHELAPNLGFLLAPVFAETCLGFVSWRGGLVLLGLASTLFALVFLKFARGGEFRGQGPNIRASRSLFRLPSFWIMAALFTLGLSANLGLFSMLPLYLTVERGMTRSWANSLIALSRVASLGTVFLAGWLTDRIGHRKTMAYVLLLNGVVIVLLSALPGSWLIIPFFLQPMFAVCFFPAGFAALSSITTPELRGVVVSFTVPLGFLLGAGIVPLGIGMSGDAGSFALGIGVVGILILMGSLLTRYLRFAPLSH